MTTPGAGLARHFGKHRGRVTNVDDPLGMGRLRATVPDVLGTVETGWALPCSPYAGPEVGLFAVPPVGAGVWIEFEAGDVSRPVWTGCWWGEGKAPKTHEGAPATPPVKTLRSEKGLMLTLDDDGNKIALSDERGQNILTIEVGSGTVKVKGQTKVVVEAPQIELVEGATHPLVYGDDLLRHFALIEQIYLTHMHPGQTCMGIPVTPMTPVVPLPTATPSLLSQKVRTG